MNVLSSTTTFSLLLLVLLVNRSYAGGTTAIVEGATTAEVSASTIVDGGNSRNLEDTTADADVADAADTSTTTTTDNDEDVDVQYLTQYKHFTCYKNSLSRILDVIDPPIDDELTAKLSVAKRMSCGSVTINLSPVLVIVTRSSPRLARNSASCLSKSLPMRPPAAAPAQSLSFPLSAQLKETKKADQIAVLLPLLGQVPLKLLAPDAQPTALR